MRAYGKRPDSASDERSLTRTPVRHGPDAIRSLVPNPTMASDPAMLLALQRTIGNAAVLQLMSRRQSTVPDVLRSQGRPIAGPVRDEMEARLGADFSEVRIHDDAAARRSAAEIGARAYTSGSHVVIGSGGDDRHTLAHELVHVIQQRSGPVDGTRTADGLSISDPSDRFESAAAAQATRAMQKRATSQHAPAHHGRRETAENKPSGMVQRDLDYKKAKGNIGFGASASNGPAIAAWMLTDGSLTGSPPFDDPLGYDYIRQLGLTMFWIRFHLVNEDAGGPGSQANLVPSSKRDNSRYLHDHEKTLKKGVEEAKKRNDGSEVFYGVEVRYDTPTQGTRRQQDAAQNFPTALTVYHQRYDAGTSRWGWIERGTTFTFNDTQPDDPGGAPISIAAIDLTQLKLAAPGYRWDNHDVQLLRNLGGTRKGEFIREIDRYASDSDPREAMLAVFGRLPVRPGSPMTFAERLNGKGLDQLATAIAQGRITI